MMFFHALLKRRSMEFVQREMLQFEQINLKFSEHYTELWKLLVKQGKFMDEMKEGKLIFSLIVALNHKRT